MLENVDEMKTLKREREKWLETDRQHPHTESPVVIELIKAQVVLLDAVMKLTDRHPGIMGQPVQPHPPVPYASETPHQQADPPILHVSETPPQTTPGRPPPLQS